MAGIPRITFFIRVTPYSTSKKTTCYETGSRNSPKDRAPRKADYEQQTTDGFSRTENAGVHRHDVSVVADRFLCIPPDPRRSSPILLRRRHAVHDDHGTGRRTGTAGAERPHLDAVRQMDRERHAGGFRHLLEIQTPRPRCRFSAYRQYAHARRHRLRAGLYARHRACPLLRPVRTATKPLLVFQTAFHSWIGSSAASVR